jgi:O-antigen/teichoic acid export membrane protein
MGSMNRVLPPPLARMRAVAPRSLLMQAARRAWSDSLLRNSLYLIASSAVLALVGFLFWVVCARLYPAYQVGLATTLLSACNLIATLSLLGLDAGIIRYMTGSARKREQLGTVLIVTALVAGTVSVSYLLAVPLIAPKLQDLLAGTVAKLTFVAGAVILVANPVVEAIFIASRQAGRILGKNVLMSVTKLILVLLLISLGAVGIFAAYVLAVGVGIAFAALWLRRTEGLVPAPTIRVDILRNMARFSFANYAAQVLGGVPALAMPLLIVNRQSPEAAAYFYMAMMMANLLYIVPATIAQSLFAEGAADAASIPRQTSKALRLTLLTVVPMILAIMAGGRYVLLVFGGEYAAAAGFLQMLALAGIFVSINYIAGAVLNLQGRVWVLVALNALNTLLALGIGYATLPVASLLGVGMAWIVGEAVVSVIYVVVFWRQLRDAARRSRLSVR